MARLFVVLTGAISVLVLMVLVCMWVPSAIMSRSALVSAGEDQLLSSVLLLGPRIALMMQDASKMANQIETYWNIAAARNDTEPIEYMFHNFGEALWNTAFHNRQFAAASVIVELPDEHVHTTWRRDCLPLQRTDAMWIGAQITSLHWGSTQFIKGAKNWEQPLQPIFGLGDSYNCNEPTIQNYSATPTWDSELLVIPLSNTTLRVVQRPLSFPGHPEIRAKATVAVTVTVNDGTPGFASFVTAKDLLVEAASNSELKETFVLVDNVGRIIASSDTRQVTDIHTPDGELTGLTTIGNRAQVVDSTADVGAHFMRTWCSNGTCALSAVPSLFETDGFTVSSELLVDELAADLQLLLLCIVRTSDVVEEADRLNVQLAIVGCVVITVSIIFSIVLGMKASTPVVEFSECIHSAAHLQFLEEIRYRTERRSIVSEYSQMNESLTKLVLKLIEYRTYLPSTMIANIDSDAQPEPAHSMSFSDSSKTSAEHSGPTRVHSGPMRTATKLSLSVNKDNAAQLTQCSMVSRMASIMVTSIDGYHSLVSTERPERAVIDFATFVTIFTESIQGTKGTVDRFVGDQVFLSWNTSQQTVGGHAAAAVKTACQVRDRYLATSMATFRGSLGIGISTGKLVCGNAGNKQIRGFNVCGLPAYICSALSKLTAKQCGTSILCDSMCHRESAVHFDTLPFGCVSSDHFKSIAHIVFEGATSSNMEWMYELSNRFGEEGILEAIEKADWDNLLEKFFTPYMNALKQKLPFAQPRVDYISNKQLQGGQWVKEVFYYELS